MFKKINAFSTSLLLMLLGLSSCGVFSKTKANNTDLEKSLLWEICGNGIKDKSYLFGTMHMICEEDYIWTDAMDKAMKSADGLVMEMDITDMKMQMSLAKQMMYSGDTTIDMFLPQEKVKAMELALADNPILKMSFKKMKPTFASAMLSMEGFNCDQQKSYEQIISDYFKKNKKKIYSLETMEQQVAALTSVSYQDASNDLYEAVMDKEKAKREMKIMTTLYTQQDISKLAKTITDDKQYGKMADDLLHNRNKNWADLLPEMMKDKSLFIAVGAGHLAGDLGVIQLLRKKGFRVVPIVSK